MGCETPRSGLTMELGRTVGGLTMWQGSVMCWGHLFSWCKFGTGDTSCTGQFGIPIPCAGVSMGWGYLMQVSVWGWDTMRGVSMGWGHLVPASVWDGDRSTGQFGIRTSCAGVSMGWGHLVQGSVWDGDTLCRGQYGMGTPCAGVSMG